MPDASILQDNAATLQRLEALATRLSDADLARDLGDGWTVAVALAHAAFWDRRAVCLLDGWSERTTEFSEADDDIYNEALLDEWRALPARRTVELVLDAARSVNATVAVLPERVSSSLSAGGFEWLMRRANHRREHIEQIEAVLSDLSN